MRRLIKNSTQPRRPASYRRNGSPPALLVFLVGVALVFGGYYLCQGVQNYLATGGLGVVEATERADIVNTATAARVTRGAVGGATPRPTASPVPECTPFVVRVPNAIVRSAPSTGAAIIMSLTQGDDVCVLGRANADPTSEWYVVDSNPRTRRPDIAYMHETVIEAVNPTPTPSITPTPLPTVTLTPSYTPSDTFTPRPTETRDPSVTDTPSPTIPPTATDPRVNV